MSRRRFFVSEIRCGAAELAGSDAEHMVRVLRVEPGQMFELSDNHDAYLAEVESARKSLVSFRILEKLPPVEPSVEAILLPALFKFDRFEWLIEKATELGVAAVQPWEAVRTDRGLFQAANKRIVRWRRIVIEASQQSRRTRLPEVREPVRFVKTLETTATVRLLLDEDPGARPLLEVLPPERKRSDRVAVLLGPEGGWTENERAQALAAGWTSCSLGRRILRAETAAVAALAVIEAAWMSAT